MIPLVFIIAGTLALHKCWADASLILLGTGGSYVLAHFFKIVFARPRPPGTESLVTMPADFSFPSAHTAQATAFFISLGLVFNPHLSTVLSFALWAVLSLFVILVGISRIYLKVHFISDVICGAVLSLVWLTALSRLLNRVIF